MNRLHARECFGVPIAIRMMPSLSAHTDVGYSPSLLLFADTYGNTFLIIGLIVLVIVLVGLWFVSRLTPKGSVLAIAVAIYIISCLIDPGQSRELHGLVGLLRLLGIAGVVLGIIDVVKKRKPIQHANSADSDEARS